MSRKRIAFMATRKNVVLAGISFPLGEAVVVGAELFNAEQTERLIGLGVEPIDSFEIQKPLRDEIVEPGDPAETPGASGPATEPQQPEVPEKAPDDVVAYQSEPLQQRGRRTRR